MKTRLFILFLIIIGTKFSYGKNVYQSFDKTQFYSVLKSENLEAINNEIDLVENSSIKEKQAYQGALMMKKAGLLKKPKDKLRTFKSGATQIETAIANDNDNVEYRFLRLIIQEHVPKIVKYHSKIDSDAAFIKQHYKSLQPAVQKALQDYTKTSKVLNTQDLENQYE